jgi:hypothetical protein
MCSTAILSVEERVHAQFSLVSLSCSGKRQLKRDLDPLDVDSYHGSLSSCHYYVR